MLNKFLALTALTVSLGATTAMAQTVASQGALPVEWQGSIAEAFYSDSASETLRTDDEIRANWDALDEADRTQVRSYCAMNMDQAGATGGMQTQQAGDQVGETAQMADEGATTGVSTATEAQDQQGRTQQMGGGGAVAGQMSGTASDQAEDQQGETEQMGEGAAPMAGAQAASVAHICDMTATM
ncbi:hypothetical protein [Pararhodobacter sp.]|uniref:hypothetical protein n=1 Tax=Pararhodobacter sp. TaxID=2127056 RepID=UPI002FDD29E8